MRDLPKHVSRYVDRHGRERLRFRRVGVPQHAFKAAPDTAEFDQELRDCLALEAPLSARKKARLRQIDRRIKALERERQLILNQPDEPSSRESRVYFLGAVGGPIKIGVSANPKARLRELQSHHPKPLRIIATAPGGREQEAEYHRRFSSHRLHGEWFSRHPDILAEIGRIKGLKMANPIPVSQIGDTE